MHCIVAVLLWTSSNTLHNTDLGIVLPPLSTGNKLMPSIIRSVGRGTSATSSTVENQSIRDPNWWRTFTGNEHVHQMNVSHTYLPRLNTLWPPCNSRLPHTTFKRGLFSTQKWTIRSTYMKTKQHIYKTWYCMDNTNHYLWHKLQHRYQRKTLPMCCCRYLMLSTSQWFVQHQNPVHEQHHHI